MKSDQPSVMELIHSLFKRMVLIDEVSFLDSVSLQVIFSFICALSEEIGPERSLILWNETVVNSASKAIAEIKKTEH